MTLRLCARALVTAMPSSINGQNNGFIYGLMGYRGVPGRFSIKIVVSMEILGQFSTNLDNHP